MIFYIIVIEIIHLMSVLLDFLSEIYDISVKDFLSQVEVYKL